ncbi:TatD family hydrolase [Parasegetibacter sp. NRK P23]|uniref:TatD family hydrolase n=1 Tax=Parasegetibacter sp. NRK P23 TaxID=2942999 RepID=UPI002044A4BF|nr:TatD family hydrolase [Parasegetibacter sp. NRK P23]MCM5530242.1 TatD family hydrolase [Parasegetibacter sp. NRK P23]
MELVDTHCHLYGEEFTADIDQVIERAKAAGVKRFYLPGIDSTAIPSMLELEARFPGECIAMMGLHPCYVKENYLEELEIVRQWLQQRKFAAVGEIGLDFYWDRTFEVQQYEAFRTQIGWAKEYSLPIVIHSRNSTQECINIVKEFRDGGLKGVFHCFSGSAELARQIVQQGFLLGIGGVLTYKNAGLPEVLKDIPLEHIVLETDAPYLTPVPFRGKRNESSYLTHIIAKLAEVKEMDVEEVARITTANAASLFTPAL